MLSQNVGLKVMKAPESNDHVQCFHRMREKVGLKVVKALKRNDDGVAHAAIDMLCALMQPMHDDYDLRQEQLNKASIMSSKKFLENLLDIFKVHVVSGIALQAVALCGWTANSVKGILCFHKNST